MSCLLQGGEKKESWGEETGAGETKGGQGGWEDQSRGGEGNITNHTYFSLVGTF